MEIDGASNTGVDDVRTLREGARYMPAKGRLKIYIIDEVHMLSTSAFNALLEDAGGAAAARGVHLRDHRGPQDPDDHPVALPALRLQADTDRAAGLAPGGNPGRRKDFVRARRLRLLARQAAGSVRDGLSLLDQVIAYVGNVAGSDNVAGKITRDVVSEVLGVADRSLLVDLARAILNRDVATTLRALAAAAERGLDLGQLARSFLSLLRDIEIVAKVSDPQDLVEATPDELGELQALATAAGRLGGVFTTSGKPAGGDGKVAPSAGAPGIGPDLVAVLFDRWARAVDEAGRAQAPRLILEMAAVDLCQAEPLEPLGDLLDRLEALEGRIQSGGPGPSASSGNGGNRGNGGRPGARPPSVNAAPAPPRAPADPARTVNAAPLPKPSPASIATVEAEPSVPSPRPPLGLALALASPSTPSSAHATSPAEAWHRVKADLERRRPRIGALLATASVLELDASQLVLGIW